MRGKLVPFAPKTAALHIIHYRVDGLALADYLTKLSQASLCGAHAADAGPADAQAAGDLDRADPRGFRLNLS
jgi:hypothetical protein